ncbi:hypothetical protein TNCV_1780181 [Trichonephila clavipes]|nr:hypothetical protein TNCV_1780181 [Trichonephila clavipes]
MPDLRDSSFFPTDTGRVDNVEMGHSSYSKAFGDGPRHLNDSHMWMTSELAPPLLTSPPHQREDGRASIDLTYIGPL